MRLNDPGLPTGAVRIVPTWFGFRVEIQMWYSNGETHWERAVVPVVIKEAIFDSHMRWWQKNRTPKKPKRKKKK